MELPHRFAFPGLAAEWLKKQLTLTHSGGTAPVSNRTSLLGPCGLLRLLSMPEVIRPLQGEGGEGGPSPRRSATIRSFANHQDAVLDFNHRRSRDVQSS